MKVLIGIYGSVKNLQHPNSSIAQKVLCSGKRFVKNVYLRGSLGNQNGIAAKTSFWFFLVHLFFKSEGEASFSETLVEINMICCQFNKAEINKLCFAFRLCNLFIYVFFIPGFQSLFFIKQKLSVFRHQEII